MLYLRMSGNIAKPENPKFGVVFQGCLSPAAAPGVIPENQPPPGPFVGIVDSQIQSVQGLQSLPESAKAAYKSPAFTCDSKYLQLYGFCLLLVI